jgi:hypothetical protein
MLIRCIQRLVSRLEAAKLAIECGVIYLCFGNELDYEAEQSPYSVTSDWNLLWQT